MSGPSFPEAELFPTRVTVRFTTSMNQSGPEYWLSAGLGRVPPEATAFGIVCEAAEITEANRHRPTAPGPRLQVEPPEVVAGDIDPDVVVAHEHIGTQRASAGCRRQVVTAHVGVVGKRGSVLIHEHVRGVVVTTAARVVVRGLAEQAPAPRCDVVGNDAVAVVRVVAAAEESIEPHAPSGGA